MLSPAQLLPTQILSTLRCGLLEAPTTWEQGHGLRDAAVLAPLFVRDAEVWLVYTLRRADLSHHAGELSFPGGRREGGETPQDCALREFEEETGVSSAQVELLGALEPRTSIARYRVQPLVAWLSQVPCYRPQASEVAEVLEIPLRLLADSRLWRQREVLRAPPAGASGMKGMGPRQRVFTPSFEFQGTTLWGLTARFSRELLARLATPGS